jgi:hypothetical protein
MKRTRPWLRLGVDMNLNVKTSVKNPMRLLKHTLVQPALFPAFICDNPAFGCEVTLPGKSASKKSATSVQRADAPERFRRFLLVPFRDLFGVRVVHAPGTHFQPSPATGRRTFA